MKLLSTVFCLVILSITLFSQEFIKDSKVHFKNNTVVKGDFYYFPVVPNMVQVADSTGKKKDYPLSNVDYAENKNTVVKNIPYKGTDKLFESIVEGEKMSLYKTKENDEIRLYILKDGQMTWLESGMRQVVIDEKIYNKEIFTYRGILKVLMNDHADLAKKVDQIACTEKEVSDLVIAYNHGHITYFKTKDAEKMDRTPNWKIYSSYSHYKGRPLFSDATSLGQFWQIGTEYFPYEGSRHSFRFGLEYGEFYNKKVVNMLDDWHIREYNKASNEYFNFNINYYYNFQRLPKANLYLGLRVMDIGKLWGTEGNKISLFPRLSPCFNAEYHVTRRLDVYGEINHLFKMMIPKNYTFGISYDL